MNDTITYQFTRDPDLLKQYFALRKAIYMQDFKLDDFSDHEDDFDEKDYTHILVVCNNGKVIGGVRVILYEKDSDILLPIEDKKFRLYNALPYLSLRHKSYTEINRLVLQPEYRNGVISKEMLKMIVAKSKALGADYFFAISPLLQARSYRITYKKLGIDFNIMKDVNIPDKPSYHGRKMCFAMIDLNKVATPSN